MPDEQDIILRACDIHHTYNSGGAETPVLHGLDLAVRRGEFVIIMGPSGCGKTTLLNIAGLMMRASRGTVEIDGTSVANLGDSRRTALRRDKLGFVFQRFNLLPVLSAEQNVALALKLRGRAGRQAGGRSRRGRSLNGQAAEALARVGLSGKARSKPNALSVGEQQRVAIARAIVGRPRLLLADEPTGSLDSRNADAVLDLLAGLNKSEGLTVVMITHNEHLVDRADRVLVMRDGRFE
ncbi:MAG: ABC transporter ATP-binding protein [Phycisphaerae bacterium]|nr:ABC transporter ATP-binding protein [Phycisphaerae bacterium]